MAAGIYKPETRLNMTVWCQQIGDLLQTTSQLHTSFSLVKMRASWLLISALVLVVAAAAVVAVPVDASNSENLSGGWKTLYAIRDTLRPVTDYFVKELPSKTPSDVADDVHEKVTDVKEWAQENDAVQGVVRSLVPLKNWLKEKADTLKDKTFQDMYDDVKERVLALDEKVATWIQDRNSN